MRYAILKFDQPYHKIGDKATPAPACNFLVRLNFEPGRAWLIGRGEPLPQENWIIVPNPACTRKLGRITSIKTNHGELHLLECLHERQLFTYWDGTPACKRPLKDGDRLKISFLPCSLTYRIVEERGKLEEDTATF